MTALAGLNGPGDGRLAPNFFALLGARYVRVVLLPHVDLTQWIKDTHVRGVKVLGVIARESLAGSYNETASLYADRYGSLLSAVQGGNEADHESESSWSMTPGDLNSLLAAINISFPNTTIVGPGLVSGDPNYLNAVDLDLVDAIAVHPYGQRPDTLQDWSETPGNFGTVVALLDNYRVHGKPIWVTEVGVSTTQVSEAFQARYCEAMMRSLMLRADVPVAMWFCADDLMVEKFGLYDSQGLPKPAAVSYMRAAGPVVKPEPDPMGIKKAIDVSSHQPTNLTSIIQQFKPDHVIPKLYMPWENTSFDHTAQQVASARDNGCTVGGYVWAYRSSDPIATIDQVIVRCASIDLVLPILWIDCETYTGPNGSVIDPGPDAEWLARAVDHAENNYGMPCGIYTGRWWVRDYFPGGEGEFASFNRLPLWLSQYDALADVNVFLPFSGYTQIAAKQYSATPIDQSVIREEYTVYTPEPVDPCAHLHQQLAAWRDTKPYKAITKKMLTALLA